MNNIIGQVKIIIARDCLAQADVARQSGVSPQVLSPLLKGGYTSNPEPHIEKLSNWLNTYSAGKQTRAECKEPAWVDMPTSKKLLEMMRLSQGFAAWTMAYEGAGVGKTQAALRYKESHSNVWIVTASPNSRSRRAFIALVAREMGLLISGMSIDRIDNEISQKIIGSNGLLIVDEAQYVSDDSLNGLRILTENKIGVTLLGNDVVRSRMSAPKSRANLYPVWSRVLKSNKIVRSTSDDIEMYIRAWGIDDKSVIQWAHKTIPATTGQIRTLRHLLRLSVSIAKEAGDEVCVSHMESAFNFIKEVA